MTATRILLLTCLIAFSNYCKAQDTLIKRTGDTLLVKILEIRYDTLRYKTHDNLDGPTYTILSDQITSLQYDHGAKVLFHADPADSLASQYASMNLFERGDKDAQRYYKNYKTAGTVTLVTTIFPIPVLGGLVTAVATSTTPPDYRNLGFPSESLMKKAQYYDGYASRAGKIKAGKVWGNFGIGIGVLIVVAFIVGSN